MFFSRRLIRSVACVVIAALLTVPAIPAQAKSNPRYAALIMDADTGVILHQSGADKKLYPASLVKMMTLMMAFEALAAGKISLRDRVTISKYAASMQPSKIGIAPGGSISVEDAIYALVTKSANDIAVALGEKLGGTESQFAAMMTRRAHEIGMTKTVYKNASGLPNAAQISTARDQAKLARHIIKTYPQYYKYFSTRNFTYRGASYHNHNRLMSTYKGMDGMKTGFIGASGFNLVASAVRNDRRLIGVVFGGRTAASRNARMAELLDQGFAELGIGKDAGTVVVASKGKVAPKPDRKPESIAQLAALHNVDPAAGTGYSLNNAAAPAGVQIASLSPAAPIPAEQRPWAIQIGAFESRARTDGALREAMARLPDDLAGGSPFIAPLKTGEGWLFRARLGGYSKEQAIAACRLIKDCLPVAPQAF